MKIKSLKHRISISEQQTLSLIHISTIDGRIEYKIPEGTQTGTTFRMRGKGIQNVNGRGRGDQYVRVNIEVPKNLSDCLLYTSRCV